MATKIHPPPLSSNNEHSEIQVLQMLNEAGYHNKTWGININGRGKHVEVKFNRGI